MRNQYFFPIRDLYFSLCGICISHFQSNFFIWELFGLKLVRCLPVSFFPKWHFGFFLCSNQLVFLYMRDWYFYLCGICIFLYVGYVFLSIQDLYFSFPIGFLYLGIIWARARLLPPCLFLARQIRLIGGATFYKAPKTPNKPFIMYLQHPILEIQIEIQVLIQIQIKIQRNIATGETSQDITPFHFFDNSNVHHYIIFITR